MPLMKRGEVWWVNFDPALGSEIKKTRPAIIISNDAANKNLSRCVVIPVTSNTGRLYPGEALVFINGREGKAMADQITTVAKSRLRNQVGVLSSDDMGRVEEAVLTHLGLPFSRSEA